MCFYKQTNSPLITVVFCYTILMYWFSWCNFIQQVVHKTLDPEWKERFELRMYEGQSSILTVEAWDRDIAAKDDYMGK